MEDICLRFCHLSAAIFKEIDNKSLNRCRRVCRIFCKSIDGKKFKWIRVFQRQMVNNEKPWRDVLGLGVGTPKCKASYETWRELASATENFYQVRRKRIRHQWHPLHIAAETGNLSLYKYVWFKTGEKNPERPKDRLTPFHLAAQNGHFRVCEFIVKFFEIKNPEMKEGFIPCKSLTPLHFAALNGHSRVCKLIIDNLTTNTNPMTRDGWTVLHSATKGGDLKTCKIIVNSLKSYQDKNPSHFYHGSTPLYYSAEYGHYEVYQIIMSKIKNKNPKDMVGRTPLHAAASKSHMNLCKLIIDNIKNKNPGCLNGWTPLYLAASNGNLEICKLILDNISIKNPARRGGSTPLHIAALSGKFEVVKMFMETLKDKNPKRITSGPLHEAASRGHFRICQLIVKNVVNIHPKNNNGQTPKELAQQHGHKEIMELLSGQTSKNSTGTSLWIPYENSEPFILEACR